MRAKYRLTQGVRALTAFRHTPDVQMAARFLGVPQLTLFRSLPRMEQIHALNVLRDALTQPLPDDSRAVDDLAVAALLHDCGKARYPVRVWQKTLPVLVKKAAPRLYAALAERDPHNPLYRGFAVKAHHPQWGAQMAAEAGVSKRAEWLIAHHQDAPDQWATHPHAVLLRALQTADEAN
jgi:hypothetical protein